MRWGAVWSCWASACWTCRSWAAPPPRRHCRRMKGLRSCWRLGVDFHLLKLIFLFFPQSNVATHICTNYKQQSKPHKKHTTTHNTQQHTTPHTHRHTCTFGASLGHWCLCFSLRPSRLEGFQNFAQLARHALEDASRFWWSGSSALSSLGAPKMVCCCGCTLDID